MNSAALREMANKHRAELDLVLTVAVPKGRSVLLNNASLALRLEEACEIFPDEAVKLSLAKDLRDLRRRNEELRTALGDLIQSTLHLMSRCDDLCKSCKPALVLIQGGRTQGS